MSVTLVFITEEGDRSCPWSAVLSFILNKRNKEIRNPTSKKCDVGFHDPVEFFVTVFGLQELRMKMTHSLR